jgi:recombination protein RecA
VVRQYGSAGAPLIKNYIFMKKKTIEHEMNSSRDELAEALADSINKNSDGKVAFFLDAEDDPSQITDWVSTGNSLVDLTIANRPNGGLPVGRITELTGLEASGKSLMGAHLLAETQKKGGLAVFIDTETSVSTDFLTAIGVDVPKMLYINVDTVEDVFDKVEEIITLVRKSSKNRLVTILVDSVAAASTKKELASDHGADGFATGKAIAISKAMRKITGLIAKQRVCLCFTNQLRQKVGFVGLGDPWTTSGGKAIAFHASLRLRLKQLNQIKNADKQTVGIRTKCTVVKNRMGPPMRSAEFDIYFDRGIDNFSNWLEHLIEWDIVTNAKKVKVTGEKKTKKQMEDEKEEDKKAKSLQFIMPVEGKDPETVIFEKKDLPKLLKDRPECRDYLYNKLCENFVMKYKAPNSEMADDIEYDEASEGADE